MHSEPFENSPLADLNPQSLDNPQTDIPNPPSSTPNPQSDIPNPQSDHNPQPETPRLEKPDRRRRPLRRRHLRRRGRPRALDDAKRREICALTTAGFALDGCARYVGCSASTIRREMDRNPQFDEEMRRAGLAAELNPLHAMRRAAATHWRAAAWLLERTNPHRFAKRDPRLLTPEEIKTFTQLFTDALDEVVKDPDDRRLIARRLNALGRYADRQLWAIHRGVGPTRGKSKRGPHDPPPYYNGREYERPDDLPPGE